MLAQLSIRDFAIIDSISITFHDGLTVLTGETGAGKSIIIDAIQLLAGGRGSVGYVRHGSKKAQIEGLFIVDEYDHPVQKVCKQFGIEVEDGQIVLERIITSSGKSICKVNSKLVTLAILREIGKTLIDIHSQHETQTLMNPDQHIHLLDLYESEETEKALAEYQYLYDKLVKLQKRFQELNDNEQETAQRLDLLNFQKRELEEANLAAGEDAKLEEEKLILSNFEKVFTALQDAYNALYGDGKGLDWVGQALASLEEQQHIDPYIAEKAKEIADHYYALEDLTYDLRNKLDSLQFDPERLNEIEGRLNELNRLKKKYGSTVSEMLEYLAKVEEEIEQIDNKESHLSELQEQINECKKDLQLEAQQLHHIRKRSANALEKSVVEELKDLYLEKATFNVSFQKEMDEAGEPKLHKFGFDHIRFLVSTNLGEPPKEINKIASGGELSRMMLALKKIFAKHQGVTSVIFDEVDTGVSGRVAQAIAEKIFEISCQSQVLCITHLPQVAAMADTHLYIEKKEKQNRTVTSVKELNKEEQIMELSRMLTGTQLTETAKDHAKELLDFASSYKEKELTPQR